MSDLLELNAESEQQTEQIGHQLGRILQSGDVVALCGPLGAGKTRLVRAMAGGLGVSLEEVRSPTFTLIHEYAGRVPVFHFDTYRLSDADEFEQLGAAELLEGDGICLVEWADRVEELLPNDVLKVEITIRGETARQFRIRANGPRSQSRWEQLRQWSEEGNRSSQ
ncbi:MAG: tRNA (adenosine(37)-N6)-threonylcarbamoyltransferase complex ATPase subunit type 1 TsaE [Planctomycetaceae bacterium]